MNGNHLAFGAVAVLTAASFVSRRGSREVTIPPAPEIPVGLERWVERVVHPAIHKDEHHWGGGSAGEVTPNGTLLTWHSTDDPDKVRRVLRQGRSLLTPRAGYGHGRRTELGGGLYTSGVYGYWSRSADKWSFLARLSLPERERLVAALRHEIEALSSSYLSAGERERAMLWLTRVQDGTMDPTALVFMANQPYNVRFGEPGWLKKVGIRPGRQPAMVPVELTGWFAKLKGDITYDQARALERAGVSGAFTPSGFATTPQLVVWDPAAVLSFGTWRRGQRQRPKGVSWRKKLDWYERRKLIGSLDRQPTAQERQLAKVMARGDYVPRRQYIPGGLAGGKKGPWPEDQLEVGILIELEHTAGPGVGVRVALERAREIATDHLVEDRHYYTKLVRMQVGACAGSR